MTWHVEPAPDAVAKFRIVGPSDRFIGSVRTEADAALIVQAVNAYAGHVAALRRLKHRRPGDTLSPADLVAIESALSGTLSPLSECKRGALETAISRGERLAEQNAELVAALEAQADWLDQDMQAGIGDSEREAMLDQARAALKKAKGDA